MKESSDTAQTAEKNTLTALRKVSKFVIYFPLGVLVLVLLTKLSNPNVPVQRQQIISPSPFPTAKVKYGSESATISQKVVVKNASSSADFDLKGPYKCTYTHDTMDVTVYIKNRNIYAEFPYKNEDQQVIIKGDCLYAWDTNQLTGEKMCGVSQYLQLFDSLSQMGVVKSDNIFRYLAQKNSVAVSPDALQGGTRQCEKQEIADSLFVVPTHIEFKEGSLQQAIPQQ